MWLHKGAFGCETASLYFPQFSEQTFTRKHCSNYSYLSMIFLRHFPKGKGRWEAQELVMGTPTNFVCLTFFGDAFWVFGARPSRVTQISPLRKVLHFIARSAICIPPAHQESCPSVRPCVHAFFGPFLEPRTGFIKASSNSGFQKWSFL